MFHSPQFLMALYLVFQAGLLAIVVALVTWVRRLTQQRDALLQQKEVAFNFMYDVSEVFSEADSMVDIALLLKRVVYYAQRNTGASSGVLYLLDPDDETLRAHAVGGVLPPLSGRLAPGIETAFSKIRFVERLVRQETIKIGEGLIGEVVSRGAPSK